MFLPKSFEITDKKLIFEWIDLYSFATLISSKQNQIEATHLPLYLNGEKESLIGHMAKNNSQWENLGGNQILTIFQGPHQYISPSWYETKDAVPTWNYISVHVYGKFEIMQREEDLIASLQTLTDKYEPAQSNYKLDSADTRYLENLRKGIVGFEIKIDKIEAKAKLSQNHSHVRQTLVIEELKKLQQENAQSIAFWMEQNLIRSGN